MLSLIQRNYDISYKNFDRTDQLEPETGAAVARKIGITATDVILALGALVGSGLVIASLGSGWGIALGIAGGAYLTLTVVARMIPRASQPTDKNWNTELHHAAWHKDASKVRELIQKGTEVEVRNGTGQTPLRQALFQENNNEVISLLIEALESKEGKTEIDEISNSATLFCLAITNGYGKEVLERLITEENKNNPGGPSGEVESPITLALKSNNKDAVALLKGRGVEIPSITDPLSPPLPQQESLFKKEDAYSHHPQIDHLPPGGTSLPSSVKKDL